MLDIKVEKSITEPITGSKHKHNPKTILHRNSENGIDKTQVANKSSPSIYKYWMNVNYAYILGLMVMGLPH